MRHHWNTPLARVLMVTQPGLYPATVHKSDPVSTKTSLVRVLLQMMIGWTSGRSTPAANSESGRRVLLKRILIQRMSLKHDKREARPLLPLSGLIGRVIHVLRQPLQHKLRTFEEQVRIPSPDHNLSQPLPECRRVTTLTPPLLPPLLFAGIELGRW